MPKKHRDMRCEYPYSYTVVSSIKCQRKYVWVYAAINVLLSDKASQYLAIARYKSKLK